MRSTKYHFTTKGVSNYFFGHWKGWAKDQIERGVTFPDGTPYLGPEAASRENRQLVYSLDDIEVIAQHAVRTYRISPEKYGAIIRALNALSEIWEIEGIYG